VAGIKINLTEKEASSESRDSTPLPAGKYLCAITDVSEEECGPESKNHGKPYYNVELTIQEGEYEGRKFWANVMLFAGALYSAVQLLKGLGVPFSGNNFQVAGFEENEVPEPDWFMGKELVVRVIVAPAKKDKVSGKEYAAKNEVKGFFLKDTWKGAPAAVQASKAQSLLP
jgi:hypothetical protein